MHSDPIAAPASGAAAASAVEASRDRFRRLAERSTLIPMARRIMSDQMTPVLAYRRLVAEDERTAPSFLFESVEQGGAGGGRQGRHSLVGAQPCVEVIGRGHEVTVRDHRDGSVRTTQEADPFAALRTLVDGLDLPDPHDPELAAVVGGLPASFRGGWVGYAGYDTVRWLEPDKLPFSAAPRDDRRLADMHFGLYREVVVIDHVDKIAWAIVHVAPREHESVDAAHDHGAASLEALVGRLESTHVALRAGRVDLDLSQRPAPPVASTFPRDAYESAVRRAKEYIAAGDAFQIVLSQRLERETQADPFDIYRALRIVNPSPYQIYLQAQGCILVASSPEILCRVRDRIVTNRPLAGTRRRGHDPAEDRALEHELLADEKERAEHVMLVDLGRNDLGRTCDVGSVRIERCMEIERYSHVMHISSTVTGRLRDDLDAWDALRATLPVGTVSGAPKVRAMQIIDELEPVRRGPYAGGIGAVGFDGNMDIALALRTMVIPTAAGRAPWPVHLQAGAGIVLDSDPAAEFEETISKAAALGRAIDLAEAQTRVS